MSSRPALPLALALTWLTIAGSVATAETGSQAEPAADYFVSEYTAIVPDWQPEASVDLSPPEGRGMVIYEVTRFPGREEPTVEQRAAADELRRRAFEAVRKHGWYDFERAVADGFELLFSDDNHYYRADHITDGRLLDPERPEFLIYYPTEHGRRLAGFMFLVAEPGQRGPQIGGPLTLWHYHVWNRLVCLWQGLLISSMADEKGECADGVPSSRSLEMLHVWFFDHPLGPFATSMELEPFQMKQLGEIDWQASPN